MVAFNVTKMTFITITLLVVVANVVKNGLSGCGQCGKNDGFGCCGQCGKIDGFGC